MLQIKTPRLGSLGSNTDVSGCVCVCVCAKDHLNVIFCVLTFCFRLIGGARGDACLFMRVSVEQTCGAAKMCSTVNGCMSECRVVFLFLFFFPRT